MDSSKEVTDIKPGEGTYNALLDAAADEIAAFFGPDDTPQDAAHAAVDAVLTVLHREVAALRREVESGSDGDYGYGEQAMAVGAYNCVLALLTPPTTGDAP